MKKIYLALVAMLVSAVSLMAQYSPRRTFADLAKVKGITSTYVSGDMMKYTMSGVSNNFTVNGAKFNIKEIKNGGLEVFTAENAEGVKNLRDGFNRILKETGTNLKVLVEVSEDGNNVRILTPGAITNGVIHDVIIETSEGDNQYTLVYLYGEITL